MEMEQVNALCEELVKAVTVMMDPSSTQRYRLEALKFCEEFKEKCPICVPCGLKLAEKNTNCHRQTFWPSDPGACCQVSMEQHVPIGEGLSEEQCHGADRKWNTEDFGGGEPH